MNVLQKPIGGHLSPKPLFLRQLIDPGPTRRKLDPHADVVLKNRNLPLAGSAGRLADEELCQLVNLLPAENALQRSSQTRREAG